MTQAKETLREQVEQDIKETESDYGKGDVIGAYIKDGRISGLKWVLTLIDAQEQQEKALADDLLERLAALEHEQWVAWSKAIAHVAKISEKRAIRWALLWVPYAQLKEEDKEKDRIWARKVIAALKGTEAK